VKKVKVLGIKRHGFSKLSDEALNELDQSIKDVFEGNVKPLAELLKTLKS